MVLERMAYLFWKWLYKLILIAYNIDDDIVAALWNLGFSVINVLKVRPRVSKEAVPLFTVVLEPNTFSLEISP